MFNIERKLISNQPILATVSRSRGKGSAPLDPAFVGKHSNLVENLCIWQLLLFLSLCGVGRDQRRRRFIHSRATCCRGDNAVLQTARRSPDNAIRRARNRHIVNSVIAVIGY
jgi:hypothetical protein